LQIKLDKLVPRPEESLREFRLALGQFATGITIITCCYKGIPMGIVANSFASVSMDPPLVLWSPAKVSRRYNAFITAQNYSIHILSNKQKHICDAFSKAAGAFDGAEQPHLSGPI
jgi:flavin reductase (DIM6/NTAB) family NADH-FMN oxidoreductase RutF